MMSKKHWFAIALLLASTDAVYAGEKEDLTQLRDTTLGLIKLLVEQGVLGKDKADALIKQAQRQAHTGSAPAAVPENVVRVPYVPEVVKKEMREEIKKEVLAQAKTERWGNPNTLPEWVEHIKWEGDLRLRGQDDLFQADNYAFVPNYIEINKKGDITATGNPYLNTTEDRRRVRLRARLGMEADVSSNVLVGMRVTTGNTADPVSTNVTIGTSNNRYTAVFDRAFIRYEPSSWLTLNGGKMANPWLNTDLVWDDDLNFDGVAATLKHENNFSLSHQWQTFVTLGAFPLQEVDLSPDDKWLYGAQLGFDFQGSGDRRARHGRGLLQLSQYHRRAQRDRQPLAGFHRATVPAERQHLVQHLQ